MLVRPSSGGVYAGYVTVVAPTRIPTAPPITTTPPTTISAAPHAGNERFAGLVSEGGGGAVIALVALSDSAFTGPVGGEWAAAIAASTSAARRLASLRYFPFAGARSM